ncbi:MULTISPECIES: hypothetical protein [unclassified Pseudomonas]|uniref:hypothetical protein n=1 Tax=unclassified Pseudomonas TaxID=196821 RepID=UPI001CBAE4C3|nr:MULTISPECIES: hypothetical protein [unclassified Pseudomonas]
MPNLNNFVAIDWRSGKDRIYFFFKDTNTYTRFDLGDHRVPDDFPRETTQSSWPGFHQNAEHLRFGFTTTDLDNSDGSDDFAWLFYYHGEIPMVCKYDQDQDKAVKYYRVESSIWAPILPYFDRIVAGTWWQLGGKKFLFRFLLNDGYYLSFDYLKNRLIHEEITATSMPGLERFKHRIITAAQNDRTFADSHYYIFLNRGQFLIYNVQQNRLQSGPHGMNDEAWPGLFRD